MNYLIIIVSLAMIVLVRFAYFFEKVYFLNKLEKDWMNYLKDKEAPYQHLAERKSRLKMLFKGADITTANIPMAQPVGYGYVSSGQLPVLENFYLRNQEVASTFRPLLFEAIGFYKNRMWESFNPVYWIELVVFFPRNFISYLGISEKNEFVKYSVKFIQILYWIGSIMLAILKYKEIIAFFNGLIIK